MATLYIVSTPIGNIEDVTIRAIKILMSVPVIACEDTRVTGQLRKLIKDHFLSVAILAQNRHAEFISASSENQSQTLNQGSRDLIGVQGDEKTPLFISYRDENEELKTSEIIQLLESGKDVALVSDAGTPLISDPGFKLINACIKRSISITAIPGPTSIITALTLSGLPTQPFWYFGYLPEKEGKREKLLQNINALLSHSGKRVSERVQNLSFKTNTDSGQAGMTTTIHPTICFLASPHRLNDELTNIKEVFGDIEIVVARELTKLHEEVYRGKVSDALIHFASPKGEFVILFQI